jgi:hypothetical protein
LTYRQVADALLAGTTPVVGTPGLGTLNVGGALLAADRMSQANGLPIVQGSRTSVIDPAAYFGLNPAAVTALVQNHTSSNPGIAAGGNFPVQESGTQAATADAFDLGDPLGLYQGFGETKDQDWLAAMPLDEQEALLVALAQR